MTWTWTCSELASNVHLLEVTSPEGVRQTGNRFSLLVQADQHFDSPHCNRTMMRRHLEEAKERNAPVVGLGDLFDVMQGRYDGRRSPQDMLPQYAGKVEYYDAVVEDAAEFHAPYAEQLAVYARGNHEEKVRKHEGTDLLKRWAYRVGKEAGHFPQVGGYGGWLLVRFKEGNGKAWAHTVKVKYFHGSGGGGPVTKGVIQTNRRAVFLPDADVVLTGHIHEDWQVTLSRERVTKGGRIYHDEQLHITVPSYKEEYGKGEGGWHVERGAPPKPVGALWLNFTMVSEQVGKKRNEYRALVDAERAR